MSRYRVTLVTSSSVPLSQHQRQYLDLDADSIDQAKEAVSDMICEGTLPLNYHEAWIDSIECLWEGPEEPVDQQLRRMVAKMLPGMEGEW